MSSCKDMTARESLAVNTEDYHGRIETLLINGTCPYSGKTEDDYRRDGFTIMTWDEYHPIHEVYLDSLCGKWSEITAEEYDDSLNVLPPVGWHNGGFFVLERYMNDVTAFYQIWDGRYYTSYQRTSYPRQSIIESLQAFISESASNSDKE